MDKHELEILLYDFDEEAYLLFGEKKPRACIVIVGGSAFLLHELTSRPMTYDIDVLLADSELLNLMKHYKVMNGSVAAHADEIPYNFEDRLIDIPLNTKAVQFKTPSFEDLIVMKLYAWRPNDIEDITSPEVLKSINWDMLEYLIYDDNETKASALSQRRYRELVSIYE